MGEEQPRTHPIRIGIVGIVGRMGREIVALAAGNPEVVIAGGTVRPGSDLRSVGDIPVYTNLVDLLPQVDVLIDFSTPESSVVAAGIAAQAGTPIVIGTTGLSPAQMDALHAAATHIPVYYARNTAHGVNALLRLLPQIAEALAGYDIEIIEAHHRHKKDAPSGTAIALAEAIASGLGTGDQQPYIHGRSGYAPRQPGEIGIHAVRGGGNTGEHTIIFASDQEEIRVSHRAFNRSAFAAGALGAASDLVGQPAGWYGPSA